MVESRLALVIVRLMSAACTTAVLPAAMEGMETWVSGEKSNEEWGNGGTLAGEPNFAKGSSTTGAAVDFGTAASAEALEGAGGKALPPSKMSRRFVTSTPSSPLALPSSAPEQSLWAETGREAGTGIRAPTEGRGGGDWGEAGSSGSGDCGCCCSLGRT